MKFFFDNNISPNLASSIRELSKSMYGDKHQILHLRERFDPKTPDVDWIAKLSLERDVCVITHDKFDKGMEADLLSKSGLIVFHLDSGWSNKGYKFWDIAVNLIKWWPRIVDQAEGISGGASFRVKWRLVGKGRFEQIRRG